MNIHKLELFYEPKVQMGMSPQMADKYRNGVVWAKNPVTGALVPVNFSVDDARWLRRPRPAIVHDLFRQAHRMGVIPHTIQIDRRLRKPLVFEFNKVFLED